MRAFVDRLGRPAFLFLLAVLAFHVAGVMSYLLRGGRLSMVPVYDDVVYLVDGLDRLALLDRQGIARFLSDLLFAHPPHAPLVALTSVFGLMLSAGAAWGPYLLGALWIAFVLLLGWVALRYVNPWKRVGILVAALSMPLFSFALAEFRPDPIWGLLVGFSVSVSASTHLLSARPRTLLALGLLFGLTTIYKPTAAPASVVVLGFAWAMQLGVSMLVARGWDGRRVAKSSGWVIGGAACVVLPYLLMNGATILAYILEVMGGDSMWKTPTSAYGQLTFYLNKGTGMAGLGWGWYAAAPLLAGCAFLIALFKDKEAMPAFAAVTSAVLTSYVIVTASSMKTLMIGSILYGAIIAAIVWSLGYLVMRTRLRARVICLLGLVVFATQWIPSAGQVHRADPAMAAADTANRAILPALTEILRSRPTASVLVSVPGPAYAGTLSFLTRQQGFVRAFNSGYTNDSWERVQQTVSAADVIVLSEAGMVGQSLGWTFPSVKFETRLLDELRAGTEFTGRPAFTDAQNRSVWLFVRNAPR